MIPATSAAETDSRVDISIRTDRDDTAVDTTRFLFTQLISQSNHLTMLQVISADRIIWSLIPNVVCWIRT